MKRVLIRDLKPGLRIHANFLVQNKISRSTRSGSPYLDLHLQDWTGVVAAKLWDRGEHDVDFDVDDVVEVNGAVEEYQGTLQLRVNEIHKCKDHEIDLRDFLPSSGRDREQMYIALIDRLRRMPEGPLRALLLSTLEDAAISEKFKLAPAAMSYHHAYLGGLLEHVLSLTEFCDKVCDHYASLDRNLVLAGLVLHDLGKIEELSFKGGFRYSTRGQLIGHITIALEIVRRKMQSIPDFPETLKDQIEHIILAHHGKLEFGSPKEPMFPEALVVHYLDDLDSKLDSMRAQYEADKDRRGDWTTRNAPLKRELLKVSGSSPAPGHGPETR